MITKICSMCGEDKPLEDFPPTTQKYKGGVSCRCKSCTKTYIHERMEIRRSKTLPKTEAVMKLRLFIVAKGYEPDQLATFRALQDSEGEEVKMMRLDHLKGRAKAEIERLTTATQA